MGSTKKIIWPIDPANSNQQLDKELRKFIKNLSNQEAIEVYPVCVMGARYAQVGGYFESYDESPLKNYLIEDCKKYLKSFDDLPLKDFVLLDNFHTSQYAEIMIFADYVDQEKPDFVVMGTHGRKGWSQTFMGSFTESFLERSRCPVFIIGPHCDSGSSLKKALMPVEINNSSGRFIESFMDNHLLGFVDELKLYHKISLVDYEDISWAPTFYGIADYNNEDVLIQAKKAAENFLEAYKKHPLSQKRTSYIVSDSIGSTPESIQEAAVKESSDFIIMRSLAGPWESRILGSVTKLVIRESKVPVLVYPCQYKEGDA